MNSSRGSRCLLAASIFCLTVSPTFSQVIPSFRDPSVSLDTRVKDLLTRLTTEEKLGLIHGASKFSTAGVPRLGIGPLWMSDGPHGVREEIGPDTWNAAGRTDDFSTAMPVGICLASTWDPDLAAADGRTIGQEALWRGKNIMLGPGVNIMRTPLNGRNFEYMGEDPYLAGQMAVGFIQGQQGEGVASCVKHFAGNNQEIQRNSIDVQMDDRTLYEIYLPAFKAAVQQGHVLSLMGAYNKFRGTYCCENSLLLNSILKKDWGFQGLVMSDWGGAHSTDGSVRGGLDLEMGTEGPYGKNYLAGPFGAGIAAGTYSIDQLDEKVSRVLRVLIATHGVDVKPAGSYNTRQHQMTARKVAEDGSVLLKNDRATLPLNTAKIHSVAIIGSNANQKFASGGMSSGIKAFYEVPILEGLTRELGDKVTVTYAAGYRIPRRMRRGQPSPAPVVDHDLIRQAVAAARASEFAIIVAGLNHDYDTEGSDRPNMKLPAGEDELIAAVAAVNKHTIVVMVSGSPVEMGAWIGKVPAVLQTWYGGAESGNAVARLLTGAANPSGKLPCTFPKRLEDTPTSHFKSYPGANGVEHYEEGLKVGYRWYDDQKLEPEFPFGFGLSYTTFAYSNLDVTGYQEHGFAAHVQFDVANTGKIDGAEVVQVYVSAKGSSVWRPVQELKGFKKVLLARGQTASVSFLLDPSAFAYYDSASQMWVSEKGEYEIRVGSSSRDIRLQKSINVPNTLRYHD